MRLYELHIPETAGWRALLTRASAVAGLPLQEDVENYLTCLLLRQIGTPTSALDDLARGFASNLLVASPGSGDQTLDDIGEQCLLFAGLFPEQAAEQLMPVSYFVRMGTDAYRKLADVSGESLYAQVADQFVSLMDMLQCLRDLDTDCHCLDALSAFDQWQETGSSHAWRVLQALTASVPSATSVSSTVN